MLRHLDLCSGIGGFSLGLEWAGVSQPVLFCDTDEWCRKVVAKHWPDVPIANDVKELVNDPDKIPDCDIITCGFPCQPFSVAGKQKGAEDDRFIWSYINEIIALKRPTWVVLENVYGIIKLELDKVQFDLESQNIASRAFIVPAFGVNAPHRRERVWIVGYSEHNGSLTTKVRRGSAAPCPDGKERQKQTQQSEGTSRPCDDAEVEGGTKPKAMGNSPDDRCNRRSTTTGRERLQDKQDQPGLEVRGEPSRPSEEMASGGEQGAAKSRLDRMVNGLPDWVDEPDIPRVTPEAVDRTNRLIGLGNAIVPSIAMQIGLAIKGVHDAK